MADPMADALDRLAESSLRTAHTVFKKHEGLYIAIFEANGIFFEVTQVSRTPGFRVDFYPSSLTLANILYNRQEELLKNGWELHKGGFGNPDAAEPKDVDN